MRRASYARSRMSEIVLFHSALGMEEVIRRGAAVEPAQFYAGFSLGAAPAQMLAQTRHGARGALLYPGSDHLFLDPDLPEYDEAAAELVIERTLVFVS